MYSTYNNYMKKRTDRSGKVLEKDLEVEVGAIADLKRVTVLSLCRGHTFHLLLL